MCVFCREPARDQTAQGGWLPLARRGIRSAVKVPYIGQMICMIYLDVMMQIFQGRRIPDLHDLAHVAGWKPFIMCTIERVFPGTNLYDTTLCCIISYISCTISNNGRLRCRLDDLDRDLCGVWKVLEAYIGMSEGILYYILQILTISNKRQVEM